MLAVDGISESSAQKAAQANRLLAARDPAATFGVKSAVGLTLTLYGGVWPVADEPTEYAATPLSLTNGATCYVYIDTAGVVDFDTSAPSGWPGPVAGKTALWQATTAGGAITALQDWRCMAGGSGGGASVAGSDTEVQYNNSGAFEGDPSFTFNDTDKIVTTRRFAVNANNVNPQTGTSYTLVDADNGAVITLDNGSAITLTVPSGLDNCFSCMLIQLGAGAVTVVGSGGTTISGFGGADTTGGQFAAATLYGFDTNEFWIGGQIV